MTPWPRGTLVRVTKDHSTCEVGDFLTIDDDDSYADWPWVKCNGCVHVTFPRDCLEVVALETAVARIGAETEELLRRHRAYLEGWLKHRDNVMTSP